jgi:hypothetical protein
MTLNIPDHPPLWVDKPGLSILLSDGKTAVYEPASVRYGLDVHQNMVRTVYSESLPPFTVHYEDLLKGAVKCPCIGKTVILNPFSELLVEGL